MAVNCSAIPEHLIESQLFGHVKGAFTGADRAAAGLFQEAESGTIFLDEIGEMPLHLQPKLLRVIEGREVLPLGSSRARKVNVRVVAATNRDLSVDVANKGFRRDLYYRLSAIHISVPPLRERPADIPTLIAFLIRRRNTEMGYSYKVFATPALRALM